MPRYTSLFLIAAIACISSVSIGAEFDNEVERDLGFAAPAAPAGNSTATSSAASVTTSAAAVAMAATGIAMIF